MLHERHARTAIVRVFRAGEAGNETRSRVPIGVKVGRAQRLLQAVVYIEPSRMGCCFCHPLADVVNDPTVTRYVAVGDIVIVRGPIRSQVYEVRGPFGGLMYIRAGLLHYETQCGGSLCCRCCRRSFVLEEISRVEVLTNEYVPVPAQGDRRGGLLHLNPGLRITVGAPSDGLVTIITVAMPDAEEFAAELSNHVGKKI